MSRSRVYQWCTWFGEGRTSLGDEPKSGRPKTSTNEENITRVDELIRCDRRMKIREIALKLEIPKSSVHEIVHDTLGYRKRCQQDNGDEDTTHIGVGPGGEFQANNNLFDNLITGDETWVHLNTPETKRDSMTWKHPSSPVTKKFKVQRSTARVMATVFWDAKGVILLDILPQANSFASNRAIWSLSSNKMCLAMTDISYDPFGTRTDDVSEELRQGMFGMETLYCKRGCCGDNRDPECCPPDDDVGQSQFETYTLITVIAAGVGGLAIIVVVIIAVVKWQLKKRRLIRDIQAINSMNRMTDINTKVKVIGGDLKQDGKSGKSKKDKKGRNGENEGKKRKLFTSSKKAPVVHVKAAPLPPPDVPPPASYATLSTESFLNHGPPTRPVGNLPVFLPNKSAAPTYTEPSFTAPQSNIIPQAPRHDLHPLPPSKPPTAAGSLYSTQPTLANVFATPLSENPVISSGPFTGPLGKEPDSPRRASPSSSKKSSTKNSTCSTPPDIPWDDADLLLYFSDPPFK
ncbi:histone-lysine N-methyltransferase SETMAR [Plakobranchus ocellatus]|uniref:Histone-lysine N-methyltransferase SETMAR n=1 Tax=Plakobranchus ocellatus TaxID=259542 RepID=A0AAV4B5R2_9GAST|nr:histone-lysine N-methyltransferase SETMAR [Plakobranchus ocellatus]